MDSASEAVARRPPRARPVDGAGLERIESSAEELARRWAAELVLARPLSALGRISLEEVPRGSAELCRQVMRALRSDAELDRLLGDEQPRRGVPFPDRPAALSGARDAATVVACVESLRGVLWETLLDELAAPGASRTDERLLLAALDRLAHVCAELASVAAARERPVAAARPARFPERPPGPRVPGGRAPHDISIVDERGAAVAGRGAEPGTAIASPASADEVDPPPGRGGAGAEIDEPWTRRRGARGAVGGGGRRVAPAVPAERAPVAGAARRSRAIQDAHEEQGPVAWIRSIGEQLERFAEDGMPFAVVLLQVDGAGLAEADVESGLAAELRGAGGGTLTREREGRYWLIAPRADRIGAYTLAARLEQAATVAAGPGAAVAVATGIAICPEDGREAPALAAHADVGLYAARWESRGPRQRGGTGELAS